nr:MAG TPA: major vault protein-like protein [Caudoviricetes sp.]
MFPDDIVKPDIRDQLMRLEWDDGGKQYCLKFNPVDVLYVKEIT